MQLTVLCDTGLFQTALYDTMVEIKESSDKEARGCMSLAVLLRISEWKRLVNLPNMSEFNMA